METKRFTVPFSEVKADGDANSDLGTFEGYGSVFGNIDLGGDIVQGGAFSKSLDSWRAKGEMPAMFGYHDFDNPVGDWLEMSEDDRGLKVRGRLWVNGDRRIEEAVKCHNVLRGTGPKGLSIGYRVKDYEMQEFDGGQVRVLKEVELLEVSVVGFAMNPEARATNVKADGESGQSPTKREIERVLRDAGLSRTQSKAFISGGYDAAMVRDEPKSADLSSVLASLNQLSSILKG